MFYGNNSVIWIVLIIILLFGCGNWGCGCNNGCGCDNGCNNGCNNGCGC